jgi:hypothetical protein
MKSRILTGAVSGVVAGIAYGMMLQSTQITGPIGQMRIIEMIGLIAGSPSASLGWILHMIVSATVGAGFGVLFGARIHSLIASVLLGAIYAIGVWAIGYMFILPVLVGLPPFAQVIFDGMRMAALVGLTGHVLYGALTGALFRVLYRVIPPVVHAG